jgi:hypothetical protein
MAILKRYHYYHLKKKYDISFEKGGRYISEITPIEDREVPVGMFEQYEESENAKNNDV